MRARVSHTVHQAVAGS
ncbi:hypothetical protein LINGRAHAP2_LOCUS11619 [Linum grandiflorum]